MRTSRLLLRRARAQAGLLALVVVLVAVVAATVAGTLVTTLGAAREAARTALAAGGADGAVQVTTRLDGADPDGQQRAAADALDDALAGRPVHVTRTLRSLSLPVVGADGGAAATLVLGAEPDLADVAHLVDGTWPTGTAAGTSDDPAPTALHASAADALAVGVGDTLVVGDTDDARTLRVVGTWLPDDADAPRWAGEALVATGVDGALGPAVVDESVVAATPGIDLVRWTAVPDLDRVEPADLAPLARGLDRFVVAAEESVQSGGLSTSGGLVVALRDADAALTAASAVTGAALALVAVIAVVALAQVTRLLAAVRVAETTVLRSRGTTVGQLTAAAALEALAVCVPAAAVGAVLAAALVGRGSDVAPAAAAAVAVVLAGVGTLTLGARAAAVRAGDRSDPAGRRSRTVATGALVLVVLAAALAAWRLARSASASHTSGDAGPAEPAAVAAVPLGVLAVALLAAALLPTVTTAVARGVGARRALVGPLAARQVARRATVYAVPVVLVTLATATGALASVHVGTTDAGRRTAAAAAAGADVRATVRDVAFPPTDAAPPTDALTTAATGGGTGSPGMPVLRTTAGSASRVGTLLAAPAADAAATVRTDGVPDLTDALAGLSDAPGWPVPAGTERVEVAADVDGSATGARLWWADSSGVLRATTADGGDGAWTATPPGREGWTLQAVELDVADVPQQVTVASLTAETPAGSIDLLATGEWAVAVPGAQPLVVPAETAEAATVSLPPAGPGAGVVRVLPGPPAPLPLVVAAGWAADDGLDVGAPVAVRVDGHPVDAVVSAVVPVVPGAPGRAALADLRGVGAALLVTATDLPTVTEVWYASDDPQDTADAVRAVAGPAGLRVDVVTAAAPTDDPLTGTAGTALVVAAACALAVALPGVAAATLALARTRRPEVGVLHALGVPPRAQARGRTAETGVVLGLAVAAGTLGGLLLGLVLAPALVRVVDTGPVAVTVAPTVQPGVLVGLLGVAVVGCLLVALDDGARVRRLAATATVREDAR